MTAAVVLAGSLLVAGCTGPADPPVAVSSASSPITTSSTASPVSTSSPVETERTARVQTALDAWAATIRRGDEPRSRTLISTVDPAFAASSAALWTTLAALPLATLRFTPAARTAPLTAPRQSLLGTGAWAQETILTWRVEGEAEPATHRVWITFVPDGDTVLIAGTSDGDPSGPQPLWWNEAITSDTVRGSVALVAGRDKTSASVARAWADRAAVAAREVTSRVTAHPDRPTRLVIEVPEDQADFERVLGVTAGSYAAIAAVAWPEGPDPSTAALRIIVNPALVGEPGEGGFTDEGLAILLTHEATHVSTRSASSPAPTWLVEGYADSVAYDAHPATVDTAAAVALDDVTRHGAPTSLPLDADFAPGAAGLDLTYARAWLACRYVAESRSKADLNRLYDAVDGGETLDDALRSVLGVDETAFVRGWQDWLTSQAGDR